MRIIKVLKLFCGALSNLGFVMKGDFLRKIS